jgi:hypothetical protein
MTLWTFLFGEKDMVESHEEWLKSAGKATADRLKEKKAAEKVSQEAEEEIKTEKKRNKIVFGELLKSSKAASAIQAQASQAISTVSTHVREVLGPVQELVDFTKATFKNIGEFFKGAFEDIKDFFGWTVGKDTEDKIYDESKKQSHFLKRIWQGLIEQRLAKFREGVGSKKDKGKIPTGLLVGLGLLGYLGIVLGGMIRKVLLPFELLYKMVLKFPLVTKIRKMRIWRRFIGVLDDLFLLVLKIPIIGKLIKGIMLAFKKLPSLPIIGRLFRGIKIGFKYLGWPLQIILSLIDFIRGFAAAEGDIFERVKAGVMVAIIRFLELPIRAFGWILEKLGWEDATSDILNGVIFFFSNILDIIIFPFKWIYNTLKGTFKGGVIDPIVALFEWLGSIIKWVFDKIKLIPGISLITEGAGKMWGNIKDYFKGETAGMGKKDFSIGGILGKSGIDTAASDLEKSKGKFLRGRVESDKKGQTSLDSLLKSFESSEKTQAEAAGNIVSAVRQGGEKEIQEPPSGMEEAATMWLNLAM